jgi:phospholipase A1
MLWRSAVMALLVAATFMVNAQEVELVKRANALLDKAAEIPPPPHTMLDKKMDSDAKALENPFAIAQHRPNYILPFSYITNPNSVGYLPDTQTKIDGIEAKYQISVKFPIYMEETKEQGLFFGFTAMSLWQVYNDEISKPFRETNYEPEIFYAWQTNYSLLGYKFNAFQAGINHQSNGQSQLRSRSWNRLFGSLVFSDDDSFYYLKTWYRIKEDKKQGPLDPSGDDNPDITHYLGHFELGFGKVLGKFKIVSLLRNNLNFGDNKGSFEFDLSYPISDRYEVLLQYFNGYGDSLIDYNQHQQRIGLGIQLSFL